jgi:hypothetical protein
MSVMHRLHRYVCYVSSTQVYLCDVSSTQIYVYYASSTQVCLLCIEYTGMSVMHRLTGMFVMYQAHRYMHALY